MVQTRSASGVDVPSNPATPSGRPRSSGNAAPSARKASSYAGSVRSRKSSPPLTNGKVARKAAAGGAWVYVPDTLTLLWLAISLPLVAWDTGYVLLRPLSMPGGALHWPVWAPYKLYGEVDHVYGFKQWYAHSGFTAAQGSLNLVETLLYLAYVYLWQVHGQPVAGAGIPAGSSRKGLVGRAAAWAVVLVFSSAVMTVSKTVLYWLNEYFSGFDNIGHNDLYSLIFLWIIPNGLWLVFPSYIIYRIGGEIIDVLADAPSATVKEE